MPSSLVARPARLAAPSLVAVVVAALLAAVSVIAAPPASASAGAFVSMINSARAAKGLPPLSSRGDLASVAASWSQQMASSGNLAHNPRLAGQVSGYRYVGENVGVGPDASAIHSAFMSSASHRANILDSDYTEVGVAVVEAGGRLWVTEVFRAPTGSSAAKAAASSGGGSSPAAAPAKGSAAPRASAAQGPGTPRRAVAPPPPPPSPEELLRGRAAAAVAGPGAAPAGDPVAQALRFVEVMRATHG